MIQTIQTINQALCADAAAFVQACEADYHRQLTEIADHIAAHRDTCPIVLISGPSGSGKTTTARMLEAELDRRGLETHALSQDNYFRTNTPEETALRQAGMLDLESPARVDEVLLAQQLEDIIACRPVELPVFDFRECVCKLFGILPIVEDPISQREKSFPVDLVRFLNCLLISGEEQVDDFHIVHACHTLSLCPSP